jgi:integrase
METFRDLWNLYYTRHVLTTYSSHKNAYSWSRVHGPRWFDMPVAEVSRVAVQIWVDELGTVSKSAANRAVNQLAAAFSWGLKRGYVTVNPCVGVQRFRPNSRKRFLMPAEMVRFRSVLDDQREDVRDFFWMCLLTGARRGNVLSMRWAELDLTLAVWQIPATKFKTGESHTIPLSAPALAILSRRQASAQSEWVFPGRLPGSHYTEPKRIWRTIIRKAELSDLTIHDLRRTVGSYMAISGASLPIIGKALGHKDQRSTQIYAHLHLAPVRAAFDDIQKHLH